MIDCVRATPTAARRGMETRRSCHAGFCSPLSAQVGLYNDVGSVPAKAGNCEAEWGGCEAAMVPIQSGWVAVRCASVEVRAATDDLQDGSAGCDRVPDDYSDDGEKYRQLQSGYHAERCERRALSSGYIVSSAAYDRGRPSAAPDFISTASPERNTMDLPRPASRSGTDTIDAGRMTMFVCAVSRDRLSFKRPAELSSKRDRVSSFEDTQLACPAWGRHHPDRPSAGSGGWRSSTEGSDHATAIRAGGGMLGGGVRQRR